MSVIKTRKILVKIKDFYAFSDLKRTTTFAGGLAYFFFSGLVPFFGLISIIFAALDIDLSLVRQLFGSDAFMVYFDKLQQEGASRTATIVMALTAAYSSTHFYFHLIRTGENVYGSVRARGAFKRVLSFAYLVVVQTLLILGVIAEIFGNKILELIGFSDAVVSLASLSVNLAFNLLLSFVLHIFAAPSGCKNAKFIFKGVIFTFVYWEICGLIFRAFSILKGEGEFGFALVAAFLLYLYFLMRALVYGMVMNSFCSSRIAE